MFVLQGSYDSIGSLLAKCISQRLNLPGIRDTTIARNFKPDFHDLNTYKEKLI